MPPNELTSPAGTARQRDSAGSLDLLVVSNREPYQHHWDGDDIVVGSPAGGLTNGIDGVMRDIGGTWIAWGDGDADVAVVDEDNCVQVPPDADDQYTLKRVWISQEEVHNYYYGFSNRVLWPICHGALTNVECEADYWEQYCAVNQRFADEVADSVGEDSVVFLQDYHFGVAPKMIRAEVGDDLAIAHFWHIPWPGPEVFRACPHGEAILRGLLGNDLLGFHIDRYCDDFLRCVDEFLPEATVDMEDRTVTHPDGRLSVESFPLGVDVDRIQRLAGDEDAPERWRTFATEHGIDPDGKVALGVDRLDYSKGIPERLDALESLWANHPETRGQFTYVQVGTETRSQIPAYQDLQQEVEDAVERINDRFATDDWQPIVYTTDHLSTEMLYAVYRRADVALVTPIKDGMNLVAQEYVAAQVDSDGVLVLSEYTGFRDVIGDEAITVEPQRTDTFASAIWEALTMPLSERQGRMRALHEHVSRIDLDRWMDSVLATIATCRGKPA